jgi:hypothetical protein
VPGFFVLGLREEPVSYKNLMIIYWQIRQPIELTHFSSIFSLRVFELRRLGMRFMGVLNYGVDQSYVSCHVQHGG